MPEAIVNTQPHPIPGLWVTPLGDDAWVVKGASDALEAAGVSLFNKVPGTAFVKAPAIPGVTLHPFQEVGIARVFAILQRHGGAILGDEMGLGKTPQGAVIMSMLPGTTLIVCPASVRHQWMAWAKRVGAEDFANLGPPSEKAFQPEWDKWLTGKAQWAAVSYNKMAQALQVRTPGKILFDEPHNYMQGRANTYIKTMWKYGSKIRYKLALTGTPYLSKPSGLWSILNILLGMRFGRAREFDARYCNGHQGQWAWENKGATNIAELGQRLKHYMVRRTKQEVKLELPPVTRVTRWVQGTKQATAALANMEYSSFGMRKALEPTLQAKIPEVVAVAEEANAPCVVFCWRRQDAEQIQLAMDKAHQLAIFVHGEFDAAVRAAMIAKAEKTKAHVITTYGASGTGLDGLQRFSSNAIFHAIDPVVATLLQALARLDRIGQENPVTATFLAMHDSVDELTVDRVVDRLDVFGQILGRNEATTNLRDALMKGGLGDINNDAVLQAIFDDMTRKG